MSDYRREVGIFGEEQACAFLKRHFFLVLERNFHTRFGELDIIAYDTEREQLVFVEVKSRSSYSFPESAITRSKYRKMTQSAWCFMRVRNHITDDFRFDSIGIIIDRPRKKVLIRHTRALIV